MSAVLQVNNVTFRDCLLPNTVKGIYLKTRWDDGSRKHAGFARITNVVYENIIIDRPQQHAIWIGPAQQVGQHCSFLWPQLSPLVSCPMSPYSTWENVTLRNIAITNARGMVGVVMARELNQIKNLVFEDVIVEDNNFWYLTGLHTRYYCEGFDTSGNAPVAVGDTFPVPHCFNKISPSADQADDPQLRMRQRKEKLATAASLVKLLS